MTVSSILLPYMGQAARVSILICVNLAGPLCGIFMLALWFPWSNTKGAASACLLALVVQLWHAVGKGLSGGIEPPKMDVSLDRCPYNVTLAYTGSRHDNSSQVFELYKISSCWMSAFSLLFTVAAGLIASLATGGSRNVDEKFPLSSLPVVHFWKRIGLLPTATKVVGALPKGKGTKEARSLISNVGEETETGPHETTLGTAATQT
ncbi:sodium-dependent multivitamin transporter-like [Haemaphysalis longicornis]